MPEDRVLFHQLSMRLRLWVRGECHTEGCCRPRRRWTDYCERCFGERLQQAAQEIAERRFDYDVAVQAEALRRVERSR